MKMKEIWTYIQIAITAIGGWLGWFLGGLDGFLYALVAFVVPGLYYRGDVGITGKKAVQ
jgi:hypothetical protein